MKYILEISQLSLNLHIGLSKEEREIAQEIEFNLKIVFNELPKACISDKINDTLCYSECSKEIESFCLNNSFQLIEHLCHKLYTHLKNNFLSPKDKLSLQVFKNPPLDNVKGKCSFCIEDE